MATPHLDACALADAIARGRLSAREALESSVARIAATDAAIAVSGFFWARPREMVSRSSNDNRNGDFGRRTRGRTPPDWVNQ